MILNLHMFLHHLTATLQPALVSFSASASASSFLACFSTTGVFSTSSFASFNPKFMVSLIALMILILSAALTANNYTSYIYLALVSTLVSTISSICHIVVVYFCISQHILHKCKSRWPVFINCFLLKEVGSWVY